MMEKILSATIAAGILAAGCLAPESPATVEVKDESVPKAKEVCVVMQEEIWLSKPFDVPLDASLQRFIIRLGEETGVDPKVILGLIYVESSYNADSIGDDGHSFGLMQIQRRWHEERIARLNVMDLLNPYDNVAVGVDYLSELYEKYGDIEMALVAYNAGPTGAWEHWFSKGLYTSEYSRKVMEASKNIKALSEDGQQ